MPDALGLAMVITAVDRATGTLEKVIGSTKKLDLSWGGLAKTVALAGAAIVGATIGAGMAIRKLGERANLLADVGAAFEGLATSIGESGDTLMAKLQESTDGMISQYDLMMSANAALRLNVVKTGDELAELIEVGSKLSESMGQDYTKSAEAFAEAIARGRATSLLQFGIDIQQIKTRVDALGITMEDAAQQGKLFGIVMEVGRETLRRTGKDYQTLGDALDLLGAKWTDFKDSVAIAAGPLANDIALSLAAVVDKFGPAIETMLTGFFEMLRSLWSVAKDTVKSVASAMGIDMDTLATDAKTWGENVILNFAQGMANAFVWVVDVLNSLGDLIASWLEPGSPPRILPKIDEWGRAAIQAYLDGMGEGIDYDAAQQALRGIERYFEKEMRPLTVRLGAIGRERADIQDAKELARLQNRMQFGYADPQQERLAQLRIEEIQAQMELRDLEAEREGATTKAGDILFPLERQVELTQALAKATEGVTAGFGDGIVGAVNKAQEALKGLTLGEGFKAKMDTIFQPLRDALSSMVTTWSGVFGGSGANAHDVGVGRITGGDVDMSLGGIVEKGLGFVSVKIRDWWAVFGPEWEQSFLEWFVTLPGKMWDTLLAKQGVTNDAIAKGTRDLFGGVRTVVDEEGKETQEAMESPWKGWYESVMGWINDVIAAWNNLIFRNQPQPPGGDQGEQADIFGATAHASGANFVTHGPQLMLVGEAGPEHVQVTPMTTNNYNLSIHTNAPVENIVADFAMLRAFA